MEKNQLHINDAIGTLKGKLQSISSILLGIANRFGVNANTRKTLSDQIAHIQENFLFVIVGEVNSGKSSFVNALLNANVTKASQAITTMDVQKIVYGDEEMLVKDAGKRILIKKYPADILKQITIVDTPGTNSRELDHQIITEEFIPYCNLVVFVFQMDNIHVQSAWDFLGKIKNEWRKKIIFVLTKADRYREDEIKGYKDLLNSYAEKEQIDQPSIFITSSYLEEQGNVADSGFIKVRDYINEKILTNAAKDKLKDDLKTLQLLKVNIEKEFELRRANFNADANARERIQSVIQQKEKLAFANIDKLIQRCLTVFDTTAEDTLDRLSDEVGFFNITWRSLRSVFVKGDSTKDAVEALREEHIEVLNRDTNKILNEGLENVKSDIQYMVIGVKNELDKLQVKHMQRSEMFQYIDAKRTEIILRLKHNLTDFIEKSPVFRGDNFIEGDVNYSGVGIAGGIAAAGAAMTMISQAAVLDITGGIATAIGVMLAGGIATLNKTKYLRQTRSVLNENRDKFEVELESNLKSYIKEIENHINQQFAEFDNHLSSEALQVKDYDILMTDLNRDLKTLEHEVY